MKYLLLILIVTLSGGVFAQVPIKVLRDTVSVRNKEFVIQNTSRNVSGFLLNKGSGITAFSETGKNYQFIVGREQHPLLQGNNAYTNPYLIKKSIKVWRNGLFQYLDLWNGISFDETTGTISFYPGLLAGDKIYIEALNGF